MIAPVRPHLSDGALEAIGARLERDRSRAALRVLECVFAEAACDLTVPIAESHGACADDFDDDRAVLWTVAQVAADHSPTPARLHSFAREALREEGFWDAEEVAGNYGACRWSDATIKRLLGAMFYSPGAIALHIGRLYSVRRRADEAINCLRRAETLMLGGAA